MSKNPEPVWQDRQILFDIGKTMMDPRKGEFIIDSINNIEDTKGNNGVYGALQITNLRMIWYSLKSARTNLSIGYNCILNITTRTAKSELLGTTQSLYVLTKFNGNRFEFIFSNLVKGSPRLFVLVQSVHRAYETSRLYRDLKLRGAIVKDAQLILLEHEKLISRIGGVMNLSSEQGNLGTLILTNVRLVWFANLAENFNVSIPYLQIKTVRVRDSKFGLAMVIETLSFSGNYILGFHLMPVEKLKDVATEVQRLYMLYSQTPIFGVEFEEEEKASTASEAPAPRIFDDVQIVEAEDVMACYYADENKSEDRDVVFSNEIGLAVEKLPDGLTMDQLWSAS